MSNTTDRQINVRMSYELYQSAKALSDTAGWTLAAWIRKAMEEKVARDTGSGDPMDDIRNRLDEIEKRLGSQSFTVITSKKEQKQRL